MEEQVSGWHLISNLTAVAFMLPMLFTCIIRVRLRDRVCHPTFRFTKTDARLSYKSISLCVQLFWWWKLSNEAKTVI